jgi:hypothetical protein
MAIFKNVPISYVPFCKIEVERKDQWLHWQSPLRPFAVNAPEKGDKIPCRTAKFVHNPNPSNILDATVFKSIF